MNVLQIACYTNMDVLQTVCYASMDIIAQIMLCKDELFSKTKCSILDYFLNKTKIVAFNIVVLPAVRA